MVWVWENSRGENLALANASVELRRHLEEGGK